VQQPAKPGRMELVVLIEISESSTGLRQGNLRINFLTGGP